MISNAGVHTSWVYRYEPGYPHDAQRKANAHDIVSLLPFLHLFHVKGVSGRTMRVGAGRKEKETKEEEAAVVMWALLASQWV